MSIEHGGIVYKLADAHTHIYPGKIAEKATGSVGAFYGIDMDNVGLPHILNEFGEKAGVDKYIVCSVATKLEQSHAITDFIADKCKKYPKFIGLAAWHQDITDIAGEMDYIMSLGLKGIKLHPDFQAFNIDDDKMIDVYREAARRKLPILFHTGDETKDFSAPRRLANVFEKVPDFIAIAAHFGGYSQWEDSRKYLKGSGVYVDTSSSFFKISDEEAVENINTFGVDHTMFGTDFPMWSYEPELERFFSLNLGEEVNRQILYGTFEKLYLS